MSEISFKGRAQPISFGVRVARSQVFTDLFRAGMRLIEETACYLDGPGRQESKALRRSAALAYATESTRLTTRLMQLASWLLLHRAVNEGEVSLEQASKEKRKVKISSADSHDPKNLELLPERLRTLVVESQLLQNKISWIDAGIYNHAAVEQSVAANPVKRQLDLLKTAVDW